MTETAWENISSKFEEKVLQSFQKLASGEKGEEVAMELRLSQKLCTSTRSESWRLYKKKSPPDEELR